MKLINVDALLQNEDLKRKLITYDSKQYIKVDDLIEIFNNLPPDYNVEQVREELRLACLDSIYHELHMWSIDSIVSRGGVNKKEENND